jgi:hypothetical protein
MFIDVYNYSSLYLTTTALKNQRDFLEKHDHMVRLHRAQRENRGASNSASRERPVLCRDGFETSLV